METLPLQELTDYKGVKTAVLQTLNLNPKAYLTMSQRDQVWGRLPPTHPLIGQKIKNTCLKWLCPTERTAEEVAEAVCVKHCGTPAL